MTKNKVLLATSILLLTLQSQAQAAPKSEKTKEAVEYLSACGNFIRHDEDNVYTGFGPYWTSSVSPREAKPSIVRFVPIEKVTEYQIETLDSAVDVLKHQSSTYVLTYSGIEEWDLAQFKRLATHGTNLLSRPFQDEEHPRAFARYKEKVVIAHGRLGISFFDLKTKKITRAFPVALSHRPLESVVNGITISGKYALAVLDSYSLVGEREKPAFRGIVVIDLETEAVVAELDGLDPGADSVASDSNVAIVSFYGQPLWKYSVAGLAQAKTLPAPLMRFWKFPIDGTQTGKASMDDKYYYTCFSRMPKPGEGSYFIKVPMAFDRRVLMLD
ncbi:MAG: hypothetical protein J0L82_19070 [Deltaproteobacteria bacterium]|jgi:hypothetical protein|nr:hypothetical protein [Deltaproteobacteria bacterium]